MRTHPNMMFDSFLKTAAAASVRPSSSYASSGMGDASQKLKTTNAPSKSQWSSPNPTQATPSDSPFAAQKNAPPPPVQ